VGRPRARKRAKVSRNWAADEAELKNEVEVLVGPGEGGWPQIIRRNISASFSSTPQNHPEKISFNALPQNSLDLDRKSDLDLRTDSIIEEPQNFEELMLKSLGLDWNVDEDKIDMRKNPNQSQSENHKRTSEKNRKREIKVGDAREIIGDMAKVKDDSAIGGDDNGDYEVRGNLGDDSLAEGSERTNVKEEEGLFSPELGNQEVKVEVFESESGRTNLKEQLFSSLLNLKESVDELKEGISVAKEVKGKGMKNGNGGKVVKEREMDYGLWQPFYNEDAEDEEDLPPSPVTMHLLPAPDLAKQTKNQEENLQVHENKPSLKIPGKLTSAHPWRRNYRGRERQAVRRTRKRMTPRMPAATWKRFSPTKLLRKAKMMLRSVQSE